MDNRRIFGIVAAIVFLIVSGWAISDTFEKKCHTQNECALLGILAGSAVVGTILLLETYVAHRKAQGTWKQKSIKSEDKTSLTSSQVWLRSVVRIMLSSIMLGLPIIFKGAFVVTFAGFMVGFWMDIMI